MTKAELDYSRSLMAEANSILAGLDNTKIHDAINWGHLGCTAHGRGAVRRGWLRAALIPLCC
jgi:hypothetical protein